MMKTPKENFELFSEMTSNGYEAARELADINMRTWNNMFQKQMDVFNIWVEAGIKQVELSSTFKDQKEYLTSQATLTRDIGEKLMASGRAAISSGNDVQTEYRAWYEKSLKSMTDNWNKTSAQKS
jgi:hypothetical protein